MIAEVKFTKFCSWVIKCPFRLNLLGYVLEM